MPTKIKVMEDGKEVEKEVFTKEELDSKIEESNKKIEENFEGKFKELSDGFEEFKKANQNNTENKELKKPETPSDDNKKGDDAILNKLDELKKDLDSYKNINTESLVKEEIQKFSKGDKDIAEKIKFEFENYRPDAVSPEDLKARVHTAASIISSREDKPSIMDNISNGASSPVNTSDTKDGEQITDNAKNIGNVLNIKPGDYEKYSSDKFKEHYDNSKA